MGSQDPFSPIAGAPQIKESKTLPDNESTPGSLGNPQATSTPINALFGKHSPKKGTTFSDLAIRKPKVRFADLEGALLDTSDGTGEVPPKRYRMTPAPTTREASVMMPDRVHSPIRTPTFPVDRSRVMSVRASEPSASMTGVSMSQVPVDLSPWSHGFRSNVSTNVGLDVVDLSTSRERSLLREGAGPTQAENAYMSKLREYRCHLLDVVKKKGEQRDAAKQMEEAIHDKMTLFDKAMSEVNLDLKAALGRIRGIELPR